MAIARSPSWVLSCFSLASGRRRRTGLLSNGGPSSLDSSYSRRLPFSCSNQALASTLSNGSRLSLPTSLPRVSSVLLSSSTQIPSTTSIGSSLMWYVIFRPVHIIHSLTTTLARHYHLLRCICADAVLYRRHAVDHQELCMVFFQDHERVWSRSCRCCCIPLPRSG